MEILPNHTFVPFGPYLAQMEVDPKYCAKVLKLGKTLTKRFSKKLAGQIHNEYGFDLKKHPWLFEEFKVYVDTWIYGWGNFRRSNDYNVDYSLKEMWINRMVPKEYNPPHVHQHCDLSFVLFLEVPEGMKGEAKKKKTTAPHPGQTSFIYGENRWDTVSEIVFTPKKNILLMFPNNLRHYVMHFDSKGERISVSGNIVFNHGGQNFWKQNLVVREPDEK